MSRVSFRNIQLLDRCGPLSMAPAAHGVEMALVISRVPGAEPRTIRGVDGAYRGIRRGHATSRFLSIAVEDSNHI